MDLMPKVLLKKLKALFAFKKLQKMNGKKFCNTLQWEEKPYNNTMIIKKLNL